MSLLRRLEPIPVTERIRYKLKKSHIIDKELSQSSLSHAVILGR